MNAGTILIDLHLLRELLKLPEDVKFVKVRQTWEQERHGQFEVMVESPALAEVLPGNKLPELRCTLQAEFCKADEITHLVGAKVENY